MVVLKNSFCHRYTTLKSYTLVPEDESGERSLTIHRDSGDIVLNGMSR